MLRANFRIAVALATAVTISLLTAGCTRGDSAPDSVHQIAPHRSAVASSPAVGASPAIVVSDDLPEVVVTSQRQGAETIAMSARDAGAATSNLPTKAKHR